MGIGKSKKLQKTGINVRGSGLPNGFDATGASKPQKPPSIGVKESEIKTPECRFCQASLIEIVDLGAQPNANSLLSTRFESEPIFPLILYQCPDCTLLQIADVGVNTFADDYPFETGINTGYLKQCEEWIRNFPVSTPFKTHEMRVLEIGCNDGSLLEILRVRGYHRVFGIEPVKRLAEKSGALCCFFENFKDESKYDWIIANNVLAHTPHLRKFVENISHHLQPNGVVSIEFPDARNLYDQWDTIYHEHYSYFDLGSVSRIFQSVGLGCVRWENILSHGGSIRAYFRKNVEVDSAGYDHYKANYLIANFKAEIRKARCQAVDGLRNYEGGLIAFGAPAKGNTYLNTLGIRHDLIKFTVDETPYKQGKFLPGSRIPIRSWEEFLLEPERHVMILPWNHKAEIEEKLKPYAKTFTRFDL